MNQLKINKDDTEALLLHAMRYEIANGQSVALQIIKQNMSYISYGTLKVMEQDIRYMCKCYPVVYKAEWTELASVINDWLSTIDLLQKEMKP